MKQLFLWLLILLTFTACTPKEKPQDPIVHIQSDLKVAMLYVDSKEYGPLQDGNLTLVVKQGDHSISIQAYSKDRKWIYYGQVDIYAGHSSESYFTIKYKKKASQKGTWVKKTKKQEAQERKAKLLRKKRYLLYVEKAGTYMWHNAKYTQEEQKAYAQGKVFSKVGTWKDAKRYCQNLKVAHLNDWQLPSRDQLKSLFKERTNLRDSIEELFWSSTNLYKRDLHAYTVDFKKGRSSHKDKNYIFYIRCVRRNK